jgi:hypothetical protein
MSNKKVEMAVCESKHLISAMTDIKYEPRWEECVNIPSDQDENDASSVQYMSYI